MADSNASLAGQDATPPPPWDVNQYKDWDAMDKVIGDLTHNGDAWADLTHNAAAERWYVLEDKLTKAAAALGTANAAFQKEVSSLKGQFVGVADQAFQDLASKVYKQSEDVYNTINHGYATTVGNIGHDIQSFAQHWWDTVREAHKAEDLIRSTYQNIIDNAKDTDTVNKAVEGMKQGYKDAEEVLYGKLREQLAGLRNRYELRGGDLSPLHVEVPFGKPGTQPGPGPTKSDPNYQPYDYGTHPQYPLDPQYQPATLPNDVKLPDAPTLADRQNRALAEPSGQIADPGAASPGAGSSAPAGTGAGGGGGADPNAAARQKALQDAKNAADNAIGALQSPGSGSGGGSPDTGGGSSPGSGGGSSPGAGMGSPDSGMGAGSGSGGGGSPDTGGGGSSPGAGSGGGSDPGAAARKKALDDAKKAADGAIGALQSPSGLGGSPGSGTGGSDSGAGGGSGSGDPGSGAMDPARQQGLQAAKDAANKAIDALRKPDDSPERKKALDDAKDAAGKAIDDLAKQDGAGTGDGSGGGSGSGSGSPANDKALQDAKDAADKAIDGLSHPSTESGGPKDSSPEAQKALHDAKDAADKAIDGLKGGDGSSLSDFLKGSGKPGDPAMGKAEHDAQAAVDKAIENLPGYNGNDAYAQALHQAKDAADKAIQELPDFASVDGTPGLGDGHTPIDGPSVPSFDSGGAGGSGIGAGASVPGVTGGPDARLDTDVAQNEGLHPVGADTAQQARAVAGGSAFAAQGASNPGMPMYPPGMGGMGGMGAMGGQKREREPNTWLQAEQGTWRDDKDDDEPPSVLGRA